jgi:hypothetical protein
MDPITPRRDRRLYDYHITYNVAAGVGYGEEAGIFHVPRKHRGSFFDYYYEDLAQCKRARLWITTYSRKSLTYQKRSPYLEKIVERLFLCGGNRLAAPYPQTPSGQARGFEMWSGGRKATSHPRVPASRPTAPDNPWWIINGSLERAMVTFNIKYHE